MYGEENVGSLRVPGVETHPPYKAAELLLALQAGGPLAVVGSLPEEHAPLFEKLAHQGVLAPAKGSVQGPHRTLGEVGTGAEVHEEIFRDQRRPRRQREQEAQKQADGTFIDGQGIVDRPAFPHPPHEDEIQAVGHHPGQAAGFPSLPPGHVEDVPLDLGDHVLVDPALVRGRKSAGTLVLQHQAVVQRIHSPARHGEFFPGHQDETRLQARLLQDAGGLAPEIGLSTACPRGLQQGPRHGRGEPLRPFLQI